MQFNFSICKHLCVCVLTISFFLHSCISCISKVIGTRMMNEKLLDASYNVKKWQPAIAIKLVLYGINECI